MFPEVTWNFAVDFSGNKIWVLESDIDVSEIKNNFMGAKD